MYKIYINIFLYFIRNYFYIYYNLDNLIYNNKLLKLKIFKFYIFIYIV